MVFLKPWPYRLEADIGFGAVMFFSKGRFPLAKPDRLSIAILFFSDPSGCPTGANPKIPILVFDIFASNGLGVGCGSFLFGRHACFFPSFGIEECASMSKQLQTGKVQECKRCVAHSIWREGGGRIGVRIQNLQFLKRGSPGLWKS